MNTIDCLASKANLANGNTFTAGKQTLAASDTGFASLNVPAGTNAPGSLIVGDLYLNSGDPHLQFQASSGTQSLAFMSDVTAANGAVAAETARATAAEAALSTDISNETTRAEGAESAENTRALAAESNLSGLITAETTRAEGVESGLGASITAEISRATSAESTLSGLITAETGRAEAAEATKANIDGGNIFTNGKQTLAVSTTGAASLNVPAGAAPTTPVIGDVFAISGPDSHLQFIDQLNAVQEIAFMSDVTAANGAVAAETARATAAEAALSTDISNETSRATTAESNLSGLITAETTRAEGAESTLTASIASEVSRATLGGEQPERRNLDRDDTCRSSRSGGSQPCDGSGSDEGEYRWRQCVHGRQPEPGGQHDSVSVGECSDRRNPGPAACRRHLPDLGGSAPPIRRHHADGAVVGIPRRRAVSQRLGGGRNSARYGSGSGLEHGHH